MTKFRIVSLLACGGLALATVAPRAAHADRIVVLNLGLHVGDAELAALSSRWTARTASTP